MKELTRVAKAIKLAQETNEEISAASSELCTLEQAHEKATRPIKTKLAVLRSKLDTLLHIATPNTPAE